MVKIKIDLEKGVKEYRRVLIQIPDGLKANFDWIMENIKEKIKAKEYWIWFGSNYGACDIPVYIKYYDFDLIIHIGHSNLFYKYYPNKKVRWGRFTEQ